MRPKPLQKPISASNAFHKNDAVGYDVIILSGAVNRSRRRDGAAWAVRFRELSDEALQMRISEPMGTRQSTSVFETRNFSTPLSDKRPLQDGNIMEWKEIRALFTQTT